MNIHHQQLLVEHSMCSLLSKNYIFCLKVLKDILDNLGNFHSILSTFVGYLEPPFVESIYGLYNPSHEYAFFMGGTAHL